MKTTLTALLALALAITGYTQPKEPTLTFDNQIVTFTNLQAKLYQDAKLVRADSKSIIVKTDDFYGNVPFTNLSQETESRLGLTADFMAEASAFREGRAKASAAALERTKAVLAADQEKMTDTNNLLRMTVTSFSGAPLPSAYGTIYPCMVTLNGMPTRVYVARLPLSMVNGYINQVNGLKGAISQEENRIANWAANLKQRQQQVDRADAAAPTYAAGDANYVNAAMAQRSAVNTSQVDLNADAESMASAQAQLDKQRNDLIDLQKTEPVLWVVTSSLLQGGLHVEVVVPQ